MNNIIEIKSLVKTYPNFTLGPIDMKIPQGTIIGYIGENGSGKSTTIKLLLDMIKKDSGEIKIFGKSLEENSSDIKDEIGVVLDNSYLPKEMKISEVQKMCSYLYSNWEGDQFKQYLLKLRLSKDMKVKALSRGMKMKLSLAIALSHRARILLLDEATSGLDPVVREEILDILLDFIQDERNSVLISSHILSDLEKIADYIVFLHEGKIRFMENKDLLQYEYVIWMPKKQELEEIDEKSVISRRSTEFGEKILIRREDIPKTAIVEKPSIEDIMVFIIKNGK